MKNSGWILVLIFISGLLTSLVYELRINSIREDYKREFSSRNMQIILLKESIQNLDKSIKSFKESQAIVDSVQDAYMQTLNIRTAPLLSYQP